jgi:hypothetical protein
MYRAIAYTDTGTVLFQKYYRVMELSVEQLADIVQNYIISEGLNLEVKVKVHIKYLDSIDRH